MKVALVAALVAVLALQADAFGANCPRDEKHVMRGTPVWPTAMRENLKVGFFGDGGVKDSSKAVLNNLIERGAEFIIHAGDFDYEYSPELWIEHLEATLPADYPYFGVIGNHDLLRWSGYAEYLLERYARHNATQACVGEVGVQAACNWEGLFFVISGVGVRGTEHPEFLDAQLGASNDIWKVCSWHKNQRGYQTGGKYNAVGWEVYETCRIHGAIINTGHEHSYARTHLMSDMENFVIANTSNTLTIEPGRSFVWCSGLGGQSVRGWEAGLEENPWWAATAASDNGVADGGLLCTFNVNGNERLAFCEFIDVEGQQFDSFYIESTLGEGAKKQPQSARKCMSRTIDMQISHAAADRVIIDGVAVTVEHNVADEDHDVHLHFGSPGVNPASIEEAHLEVYGLVANHNVELSLKVLGSDGEVIWIDEDDDWEEGGVWASPDLSSLIREALVSQQTITITVESNDGSRTFAAYETDSCLAPSLFVTYRDC